jgi:hypothetical protein
VPEPPTIERCPSGPDLLLAQEGELPVTEWRAMLAHLRSCAACRARLDGGESLIREYEEYFAEIDATTPTNVDHFVQRLHRRRQALIHAPMGAPIRTWLSTAAVVALLVIGFLSWPQRASLSAEELIQRAVQCEQQHPVADFVRRVQVRLLPIGMTAPAGSPLSTSAVASREPSSLTMLLHRRGFDPQQTIRVTDFAAWRMSVREKRDEIEIYRHEITLRTTVTTPTLEAGSIREVQLTVARDTYQVLRQRLVFEGFGAVEIVAVGDWIPRTGAAASTSASNGGASTTVDREMLEQAELDARLVLGEAGLSLRGDVDVRVSSTADAVHVDAGVASEDERQTVIAAVERLDALPHVDAEVHVRAGAGTNTGLAGSANRAATGPVASDRNVSSLAAPGTVGPVVAASGVTARALDSYLDRALGRVSRTRKEFVPDLVKLVSSVDHRLGTLQDLATRYSDEAARQLTPSAQTKLQRLLDLHYRALNTDLIALDRRLAVLYGATPRSRLLSRAPADWRPRATTGRAHASTLGTDVQHLLTHGDEVVRQLSSDAMSSDDHATNGAEDAGQHATAPRPREDSRVARTFAALWNAVSAAAVETRR